MAHDEPIPRPAGRHAGPRIRPRAGLLVVVSLTAAALAGDEPNPAPPSVAPVPGLVIEQRSSGLPGESERERFQHLIITPTRLALVDEVAPRTRVCYLLHIDRTPPAIWKISGDGAEYRECKELAAIQDDRDLQERQLLAMWREEGLSDEKLAAALKEHHLAVDGRREVTVEESEVTEKKLGYTVRRVVVRENRRIIVDALVTTDVGGAHIPLYDFYRHVGAFSEEVLEKLRAIPGVPLHAEITVVTATLNYKIRAEVTKLDKDVAVDPAKLELPSGAKFVEESAVVPCPNCGRQVQRANPGASATKDGQRLFFCSRDCLRAFKSAGRLGKPVEKK